jgi:hypothetical protein
MNISKVVKELPRHVKGNRLRDIHLIVGLKRAPALLNISQIRLYHRESHLSAYSRSF